MAIGGQRPKPAHLKVVEGNPGHRPVQQEPSSEGQPVRPEWLKGRGAELWAEVVGFAHWLTRAESYKLAAWCERQADFERHRKSWSAADRREHRTAGSELGFDPVSRARMGQHGHAPQKSADPAEGYFAA